MNPECINLKQVYGRKHRVVYEESYQAQYGPGARTEDPWMMILVCRYGHIYPHGGRLLAASVDGFPRVAGLLRELPCCRVHQDGDRGELTVVFDVKDFDQVARILKPRRRRQVNLTPDQREAIGRRLRRSREGDLQALAQKQHTARRCDCATLPDHQVGPRQLALFDELEALEGRRRYGG